MTALNTPEYDSLHDTLRVNFSQQRRYFIDSVNDKVDLLHGEGGKIAGVEIWDVRKIIADAEAAANYVPDPETEGMDVEQYMAWALKNCPPEPFTPAIPHYNDVGDHLEIHFTDESYYGDHQGRCTLLRGQESKEIVGVIIHRVKKLIEQQRGVAAIDAPLESGGFSVSDVEDIERARQNPPKPASEFSELPKREK